MKSGMYDKWVVMQKNRFVFGSKTGAQLDLERT